jgi:hypothetical protein
LAKFTKAQRIFNREHMNRPLGEFQKNMIDGVLKKYGKYTVKRPVDKQTIRCLNSLVKRGLVTFDAETETYRLKPSLHVSDPPKEARGQRQTSFHRAFIGCKPVMKGVMIHADSGGY